MTADCRQCGSAYATFPSYLKRRPKGGFCSRACRVAAAWMQPVCAQCDQLMPVRRKSATVKKGFFCSASCRDAYRLTVVFDRYVDKSGSCWLWTGARYPAGYGEFRIGDESYAHRLAWFRTHGVRAPKGLTVMHACDTPACVNPAHLTLGTQLDNIADAVRKGRHSEWARTGFKLNGEPVSRSLRRPLAEAPEQFSNLILEPVRSIQLVIRGEVG